MKLEKFINKLDIVESKGNLDIDIKKIVHDSREADENCMFVAIKGFNVDGHSYINDAINNGAKAIILQDRIKDISKDITFIRVNDSRSALASVSSTFYNEPSKKINLIGVTGTNGKTTTTYLIKSILEQVKKQSGIIGTMGNVITDKVIQSNNTTPESLDLQKLFNMMVHKDMDSCIMEVSSHSLQLKRVDECYFNVGIYTNLSPDHLDLHKTIDNYLEAKLKLFYKTSDYNIINIDDKYGRQIVNRIKHLKTSLLTYGIDSDADIIATDINYTVKGVSYKINSPKGSIKINIKIPGKFSVYNSLAAASCAIAYNISLDKIKEGLESIDGVKGRFEVIDIGKNYNIIIDYAHTPDGLEKVLKTIKQFAKGRIVVLFGAGGDRDKTKRPIMAKVASKYSDFCIITSDNPRTEDPETIIKDVLKGIDKNNCEYITIVDREQAIKYAIANSKANDIILLAGKGHETYTIIGNEKVPFDEREVIKKAISENM